MVHKKFFLYLACFFLVSSCILTDSFTVQASVVEEGELDGMQVESNEYGAPANNTSTQDNNKDKKKDKKKKTNSGGSLTLDNDGNAKEVPYGDAKFPNSYEGADYYDCYVPYNLTCEDIGGYSTSVIAAVSSGLNYSMSGQYESRRKIKIAEKTALYKSVASKSFFSSAKCTVEEDTGIQILEDTNGAKYYTTAIQMFFYMFPGIAADKGFPDWNTCTGQLVDIVLTDGTCIHFAINDTNSENHTNGGPAEPTLREVQWVFAPMKQPQYKNIYQAGNANMLELGYDISKYGYSSASKWLAKYNIGSEGNKIAYYRLYNKKIADAPKRASGVGNDVAYSMGNASISSSGGESSELGVAGSSIVSEWELAGMPTRSQILANQTTLTLPTVDDLSVGDAYNVSVIKGNIELATKATAFERARVLVVFIGLLLEVYALLLLMALLLDKVNVFIDISLVNVLTLGKVQFIDDSDVDLKEGMANSKKLAVSVITTMIIGFLLISGSIFPALGKLVYVVSQRFI